MFSRLIINFKEKADGYADCCRDRGRGGLVCGAEIFRKKGRFLRLRLFRRRRFLRRRVGIGQDVVLRAGKTAVAPGPGTAGPGFCGLAGLKRAAFA